jgi:hypothetical protein
MSIDGDQHNEKDFWLHQNWSKSLHNLWWTLVPTSFSTQVVLKRVLASPSDARDGIDLPGLLFLKFLCTIERTPATNGVSPAFR